MRQILLTQRHIYMLFFVLLSALALRLSVLYAPVYHWPQGADHFIYFEMAQNASQGKGGVIDFIYSYLAVPKQITHLEDYYEPFYGWLCGLFMRGESYLSSLTLPFLSNFLQLILVYLLTLKIATEMFEQKSESAKNAGLLAVTLLGLHPLFIERSAWIMKESVVGCCYLILAWLTLKTWTHKMSPIYLSVFAFFIGTLQYESWPILGLSFFLLYLLYRRWSALLLFTGCYFALLGGYSFWFYQQTGLWISTKFYFLTSSYNGASFDRPRSFSGLAVQQKIQRAGLYVMRRTVQVMGVPWIALLFLAGRTGKLHFYAVWLSVLTGVYLFVHSVAVDLRIQDYMVLWLLTLPLVSCAIVNVVTKKQKSLIILFLAYYALCFALLNGTDINNTYFFQPMYLSYQSVPAVFALVLTLLTQARAHKIIKWSPLWLIPLILYDFNISQSYATLYKDVSQELYYEQQAMSLFINRHLPADAVLMVSNPYAMHYFTQRRTLKHGPASLSLAYPPDYAVGLSEQELLKSGFKSTFFHQVGKLEIRRMHR